jgi:hypothetical protein
MDCVGVEEQFSAHLEDELDYQATKTFETHLANCELCHHGYILFRESVNLLHRMPSIEPSPSFDTVLQTRLANSQIELIPWWRRALEAMRAQSVWAFSGIAMGIGICMIAGIYLYQNTLIGNDDITVARADNTPSDRRYVIRHVIPPPRIRVDDSSPWKQSPLVPDLNRQRLVEFPAFEGSVFPKEVQPQRVERNYILQTVTYTDASTSGGW